VVCDVNFLGILVGGVSESSQHKVDNVAGRLGGDPTSLESLSADTSFLAYIGVVNLGDKLDLGGLEGEIV
jgi:hypothetical protein